MEGFDSILKKEREARGIPIEEVSEATKVNVKFLKALEEGDYSSLPGEVYGRGFLRAYIRYLGIDGGKLIEEYNNYFRSLKESISFKKEERRPLSLLVKLAVLLVILVALWSLYSFLSTHYAYKVSRWGETSLEEVEKRVVASGEKISKEKVGKEMSLEGRAIEETWIRVVADGRNIFEGILRVGEGKVWQAKERFELSIGNAGGIELRFNGTPLGRLGKRGEVIRNYILDRKVE